MKKAVAIVSFLLAGLLIYDMVVTGAYLKDAVVLVYIAFVGGYVGWLKGDGAVGSGDPRLRGDDKVGERERSLEDIILGIIRVKGRAKRRDLLPHMKMSKSSLVRLLDDMEERGLIVQVGERKASYYVLVGTEEGASEV